MLKGRERRTEGQGCWSSSEGLFANRRLRMGLGMEDLEEPVC